MLDLLIKHKIKFTIAFLLLICVFAFYIYYSGENSKFYINNPNKQHSLESNNNHKILKENATRGIARLVLIYLPLTILQMKVWQ
ncbi:TPA: hypothetical protein RZK16_001422 [Campylobacter coli]|nr:hypothetical protein [Campylobacter coli]